MEGISAAATAVGHNVVTSNRVYGNFNWSTAQDFLTDFNLKNAIVADMDAADTCVIQCRVADMGSDTVDVGNSGGYHYWSVTLIA